MERKKIVIIGGVAGGASAAARARRINDAAEIVLFERGEYVSFANCGMPYHIGGAIADRKNLLVQTPAGLKKRFDIDVRIATEVTRIDRPRRQVHFRNVQTGVEGVQPYDALILSPGAEPIRPPIPGAAGDLVRTLRGMGDMDAIKQIVDTQKPAHAVVIGGGYIGLEMTEALRHRGVGVTLVELAAQVFGVIDPEMAAPVHQALKLQGVDLRLGTSVTKIEPAAGGLTVQLSSGEPVACGLVILAIGVRPDVSLAREAGLAIGQRGGIAVDDRMRTSDPDIFAVGDAVEVTDFIGGFASLIPLAGPANRQGRIAADNALGRDSVYRKTQGTAICKVFDLAVGMTGLSEKGLQRAGIACEKVYVHPASHAGYYPGAAPMSLKLLFDPTSGKILGAQAVGTDGVDKRIDVLAVALRAGMTVYDLEHLELCYAPPYGSAKDPVNYAGFVAANILRGDASIFHARDAVNPRNDQMLLDVRMPAEVQAGAIPGAVNIPVDELRSRLAELPRDKELLVYCQVGLRGYVACRMLQQAGFRCRNLTGGYKTYAAVMAAGPAAPSPAPQKKETRSDTGADDESDRPAGDTKAGPPACHIDATCLQCPGPIMRLHAELAKLPAGAAVTIAAADPGFAADVKAWCQNTGNALESLETRNKQYFARIIKGTARPAAAATESSMSKNKTIVVFSNDLDKAMAAFIIANGAAAMGNKVTLFFTFWGLNILRRPQGAAVAKSLIERMFGWMMPRGAGKLTLSKMNMGGMGTWMMKGVMKDKKVAPLPELIESARAAGVRLVACTMTMDIMGIHREELIDGIELGGVASYLDTAGEGNVNLFI